MKTLRIFISSPGDVVEERERAKRVVEGLRRRYARRFFLKPLLWEDLALQADKPFQEGIDRVLLDDKGVDIAIFILWSRMGQLQDGGQHRSGTEREFDLMRAAREQSGGARPALFVYTRQDEASFVERLRAQPESAHHGMLVQKATVERFITETFQDSETGRNLRAFHRFGRPATFSQRLRVHLMEHLDELAGGIGASMWNIDAQGPPFLGLESYQPHHADVFFGREEEILEARHALRDAAMRGCSFLLLSGASGSGKSSLARAGILPEIITNEIDGKIAAWRTLVVTPDQWKEDPVASMVAALASKVVLPELNLDGGSLEDLVEAMRREPDLAVKLRLLPSFTSASREAGGGVRLLILIDQFEQFFTLRDITPESRSALLSALWALCRCGHIWVVATMRSDIHSLAQEDATFSQLVAEGSRLDLRAPAPDALARLIEEPAWAAGLTFEQRDGVSLSGRILKDAASQPELLPLISFVLRELFERRSEDGVLRWNTYETLGGVEGSLARSAEKTWLELPREARRAFDSVFKRLVQLSAGSGGEGNFDHGARPSQQRVPCTAFKDDAGAPDLVNAFVEARLFTLDSEGSHGVATVRIAHESLLRAWPRAIAWITENEQYLKAHAQLQADCRAWLRSGKRAEYLLPRGRRLKAAQRFANKSKATITHEERHFVKGSLRQARASSVWQKVRFAVGVCVTVLSFNLIALWLVLRFLGVPSGHLREATPVYAGFLMDEGTSRLSDEDLDDVRVVLENSTESAMPDQGRFLDTAILSTYIDAQLWLGSEIPEGSKLWRFLDYESAKGLGIVDWLMGDVSREFDIPAEFCKIAVHSGNDLMAEEAYGKMIHYVTITNRSKVHEVDEEVRYEVLAATRAMVLRMRSMGRDEEAWQAAADALGALYGEDTPDSYDLTWLALLCGKYDVADAAADRLTLNSNDMTQLIYALAVAIESGQRAKVESLTKRLDGLEEMNWEVFEDRMYYDFALGQCLESTRHLIRIGESKHAHCQRFQMMKGRCLIQMESFAEARDAFLKAAELSDAHNYAEIHAGLAICHWKLGDGDAARKEYYDLIQLNRNWRGPWGLIEAEYDVNESRPLNEIRLSLPPQ